MTATSSSDRYEAAHKALAQYDENERDYHALPEREQEGRNYEDYEDNKLAAADSLAEALRALIEPPTTNEEPHEVAARVLAQAQYRLDADAEARVLGLMTSAVVAGIQAAWNSWEPETAATESQDSDTPLIAELPFIYATRDDDGLMTRRDKVTEVSPIAGMEDYWVISRQRIGLVTDGPLEEPTRKAVSTDRLATMIKNRITP